MKVAVWKRIVRGALAADPSRAFREELCYATPVGNVLFGVAMDTPRDPDFVFITRIAMPLFVPTRYVHDGVRAVGKDSDFISVENDDIPSVVSTVWASRKSELWELKQMIRRGDGSKNSLQAEVAGYAALLIGRPRLARRILRTALFVAHPDGRPFAISCVNRMELISGLLEDGRTELAVEHLKRWRAESIANLGIQERGFVRTTNA